MVARFDCNDHTANIVSIPRDTLVNVPWAVKKVNSVYGSAGIDGLVTEIEDLVGFGIDSYAVVNTYVFQQIIDCIGGVYFDVPIYMYYDDPEQDLHISLAPGYQLLNGYQCEQVVRFRQNNDGTGYGSEDVGRMQTQQNFLKAVAQQTLTLSNVDKVGEFAKIFQQYVDTDLSLGNLAWLGKEAISMGVDKISFSTLPNEWRSPYIYLDPDATLELVNQYLNPYVEDRTMEDLDIPS